MYTSAFAVAFIVTLIICMGIIFMKWIIMNIGAALFALILIIMTLISLLIIGERENGE